MSQRHLSRAIHLSLLVTLAACTGAEAPPPPTTSVELAVAPPPAPPPPPATCAASMAWITSPTEPADIASSETFCDFYQFSWQWFLAQVSPANASDPTGDRVFETNRVVDPQGGTNQCAAAALTGRAAASKRLTIRSAKPLESVDAVDFEDNQADGNPLYDQAGNALYFNMWYSPEECSATSAGFVAGTLEIKTAWRVLATADPTYFTMQATLPSGDSATLGLVGFHLVNWTPTHPEMIWASFEHKANAPSCDGSDAPSGWTFASDAAAACLVANPVANGSISPNCASFDFNTPPANPASPSPPTGTPDEVCRLFENGNQPGTSINGNDNAANLAAIQQLNAALVGSGGLLAGLPADNPMAIWQNYEMVGGLWTKGGAASGNPPVPNAGGPADPNSPQRGSLELANMTMETYQQGAASPIPNCFGCHNFDPSTPLQVSHIAEAFLLPPSAAPK
jgi:hypothetical protein